MYDIAHEWGSDLTVGSSGDLALASGSEVINQRIYRRLLTNAGDYLWNIDYGGGLSQFIGLPAVQGDIEAVVTSQLLLETAVPSTPAPQITTSVTDLANGYVVTNIIYTDPTSQQPIALNVTVG